ncbi:MAG: hypothetical protein AAFO72_13255, partial [Pseudomonadota bacterium]
RTRDLRVPDADLGGVLGGVSLLNFGKPYRRASCPATVIPFMSSGVPNDGEPVVPSRTGYAVDLMYLEDALDL